MTSVPLSTTLRSTPSPLTASERSAPLRLTSRGRGVVAVALALAAALAGFAWDLSTADADPAPQPVVERTVHEGDTLWDYAREITPVGGDVRDSVEELKALNKMSTSELTTGEQILLPQ